MWNNRVRFVQCLFVATLALAVLGSGDPLWAGVYNKCRVPPIVASVEKPNVMLLVDFSGSMQFGTYWGGDGGYGVYWDTRVYNLYDHDFKDSGYGRVYGVYDRYRDYYGFFDPGA